MLCRMARLDLIAAREIQQQDIRRRAREAPVPGRVLGSGQSAL